MPELQGVIIHFSLKCENRSGQFESCLGGKVLGTWLEGMYNKLRARVK